jgi:hypothetical protein
MGRPSATPRLRDLDPKKIGEEVITLVRNHMIDLVQKIDPSAELLKLGGMSSLRWTAQVLTAYAKHGLPSTDWPHHGCARDAVQEVSETLYSRAGEPYTFGANTFENELELTKPIDIVLLAAWCRVAIDSNEKIDARMLGCLAGIDPDHVRLLARKGEIDIREGVVRPKEAKRWLRSRDIEGL